jgi:hypothetical protein
MDPVFEVRVPLEGVKTTSGVHSKYLKGFNLPEAGSDWERDQGQPLKHDITSQLLVRDMR